MLVFALANISVTTSVFMFSIFKALAGKSTVNLNHCNTDGYTPLHLACLSDKPDCVKALIQAGANVNIAARNSGRRPQNGTDLMLCNHLNRNTFH